MKLSEKENKEIDKFYKHILSEKKNSPNYFHIFNVNLCGENLVFGGNDSKDYIIKQYKNRKNLMLLWISLCLVVQR